MSHGSHSDDHHQLLRDARIRAICDILTVLTEPPSEAGSPEEVALVGEGEANPLVVLARELLGPRLDHLDYQTDDFISNLSSVQ